MNDFFPKTTTINGNDSLPQDSDFGGLTLSLLVFGVRTNYHDSTAPTDDAALFAHFFDRRSNFHA